MNPLEELRALTEIFPEDGKLIELAEHVPKDLLPIPYRKMLAHDQHMTVTMESYYGGSVDVTVIDSKLEGDTYTRKIVLTKSGSDRVVQFGIVRFNFQYVTEEVREKIIEGKTPLGRVLIQHNVLRHVDLGALLKVTAGPELSKHLQMKPGDVTYGRLATIFCNNQPAVDLLEVPAPLD